MNNFINYMERNGETNKQMSNLYGKERHSWRIKEFRERKDRRQKAILPTSQPAELNTTLTSAIASNLASIASNLSFSIGGFIALSFETKNRVGFPQSSRLLPLEKAQTTSNLPDRPSFLQINVRFLSPSWSSSSVIFEVISTDFLSNTWRFLRMSMTRVSEGTLVVWVRKKEESLVLQQLLESPQLS